MNQNSVRRLRIEEISRVAIFVKSQIILRTCMLTYAICPELIAAFRHRGYKMPMAFELQSFTWYLHELELPERGPVSISHDIFLLEFQVEIVAICGLMYRVLQCQISLQILTGHFARRFVEQ